MNLKRINANSRSQQVLRQLLFLVLVKVGIKINCCADMNLTGLTIHVIISLFMERTHIRFLQWHNIVCRVHDWDGVGWMGECL